MKVEEETTSLSTLTVPHEGGRVTFQYPAFGGSIEYIADSMEKAGLRRPISPEVASLVYSAFDNSEGKMESEVIRLLNERWIWEFTGNLYLPKSNSEFSGGVIIEYNPKIVNGKAVMNERSLVRRLNGGDPNVKFVPSGFKLGKQGPDELRKNPYMIARYGEEGAEKLAEVASKDYKFNPAVWGFDINGEETTQLSALSGDWADSWLDIDGAWDNGDDNVEGYSFGVIPL